MEQETEKLECLKWQSTGKKREKSRKNRVSCRKKGVYHFNGEKGAKRELFFLTIKKENKG